ncbi:MAG: hypothetical protein ABIP78_12940 [Pyrinomonadaceae bacterium]
MDIEEDVLQAAKETAEFEGSTAGKVISTWARQGFFSKNGHNASDNRKRVRNGVPLLPSRGKIVTMKLIQEIMDEEGI